MTSCSRFEIPESNVAGRVAPFVERFHRVKGARARTQEGTGIGLALVAELVKLHGGCIRAESTEGLGTSLLVSVPRGREHLPPERVTAPRAHAAIVTVSRPFVEEALRWSTGSTDAKDAEEAPSSGLRVGFAGQKRARILVADDNADMREFLCRILRERWHVEAVSDGRSALDAIRDRRPDLVLSDVMMPGLDGFGLLKAVREDAALRMTPVILLSARAGSEATAEGLTAGANDYIVKPFSTCDLLVRVASKLAVAEVARAAAAIEESARRRLYSHFMQAPLPIGVLRGPSHVVELANSIALSAWGKDETILGKPLIEGLPELQGQPFLGYLDEVLRTGVAYRAKGALARLARGPHGEVEDVYFDFVYAPRRTRTEPQRGFYCAVSK